ncbi:MAG: DUF4129 domain-containing protein [Deltaproteobacteria bacterium]|nr:DUF4129 domain-containing protein [Deltaproteobacteria bacterium]
MRPRARANARLGFGDAFAKAKLPLFAYWLLSLGGLFAMAFTIVLVEGGLPNDFETLMSFEAGAIVGLGCGNLLALSRVRFWLNVAFGFVNVIMMIAVASAMAIGAEVVLLGWIGFLMGFGCGHLALSHRFGLAAAWLPILCWVGAIMIYLNDYGRVAAWERSKISAWMPLPLLYLFLLVVLILFYMAAKESHRLALWELLGGAPWKRTLIRAERPRVKLQPRGWAAILALTAIVFAGTAIIAPYLWRTGKGDRKAHHADEEPRRPRTEPIDDMDWDGVARALRKVMDEAEKGGSMLLPFIPLFLLNRPVRRLVRMRHWRRPLVRVPPTERVKNLWRLVLTGATDAGAAPRPGSSIDETVEEVQERAHKAGLARSDSLREAAAIYGRVRYGLGIQPDDISRLEKAADQAYHDSRRTMTGWQRIKCWWRKDA